VFRLAVHTVGGVVTPGMPIMDIVPDNEALIVEARISPVDIDRVTAGLKASIRFTSFNRNQVPKIDGKVMEVSPDRVLDEKTGASFYIARVQINEQEYDKLKGLKLLPGMPAEVMINTGSRTMLNYLIQPITDVMSHSFKED
jgi:epimerase transport system membrane fusion protein